MLPHVIPSRAIWQMSSWSHITGARYVLKISPPFYVPRVEQVHHSRHVCRDLDEVIVIEPEIIAAYRGDIIWLRGMCVGKVFGEEDALFHNLLHIAIVGHLGIVLGTVRLMHL